MAATLELFDGTDTLDLHGSTYNAFIESLNMPPPPVQLALAGNSLSRQTYGPREISMALTVTGASVADLEADVRKLDTMLATAAERQMYNQTSVVLKTQTGDTDADDIEYRVLRGEYRLPSGILNATTLDKFKSLKGVLSLLVEPLGRLSQVTLTQVTLENEQDGNNNNFVDIEGAFGAYLSFNGTTDLVTVTDAAKIQDVHDSGGGSGAWIYVKSDGEGSVGRILNKGSGALRWYLSVVDESGTTCKLQFYMKFDSTDGIWKTTDAVITLNQWHYVEESYDSDSVSNAPIIYVDGLSVAVTETQTPSGTRVTDASHDLFIGNSSGASATFDGFIDEVQVYDATQSAAVILARYQNELVGNEAGLVAYFPMNDSVGTALVDHSSTPLTAALTGCTWTIGGRHLGTEEGRMQIKIADEGTNAWNGSKKMWIAKRSGARRVDDLFFQGQAESSLVEGEDPTAGAALAWSSDGALSVATASGGEVSELRWTNDTASDVTMQSDFLLAGRAIYQIAGGSLPEGIFRVLVRAAAIDDSQHGAGSTWLVTEQGLALGYDFGDTPNSIQFPSSGSEANFTLPFDSYEILDLGELVIAPTNVPDGYTAPTLDIIIHGTLDTASARTIEGDVAGFMAWRIDYVFLLPFDEGMVAVDAVAAADRILIDDLSNAPGVYILNSSDVVQKAATKTGGPFSIGPEPTRIYVIRDDTDDPSTIKFDVDVQHTPQVIGI